MSSVKLTNVRLAFPEIFKPGQFDENSPLKYGATFLIPKNSKGIVLVNKAIKEVAAAKWGAKADAVLKSISGIPNKYCFTDGDLKSEYDGFADTYALTAKSDTRPVVKDRNATPLTSEDGKPYAGCYVNAIVEIWAQDNKWGKGMRADLKGVQFFKDGDAFSGSAPLADDAFDDLSDGADEDLA